MYEAEYHPSIRKDLRKIDPQIREKIRTEHIPRILSDPEIGENLGGNSDTKEDGIFLPCLKTGVSRANSYE